MPRLRSHDVEKLRQAIRRPSDKKPARADNLAFGADNWAGNGIAHRQRRNEELRVEHSVGDKSGRRRQRRRRAMLL